MERVGVANHFTYIPVLTLSVTCDCVYSNLILNSRMLRDEHVYVLYIAAASIWYIYMYVRLNTYVSFILC